MSVRSCDTLALNGDGIRMLKRLFSITVIASLAISGFAIAPKLIEAAAIAGFRHDPSQVLLYRLSPLDIKAYETAIESALAKDDPELARSLVDLATDRGMTIGHSLLERIAAAEQFSILRSTGQFLSGAVTGEADSPTAFAGALASDLTVIGDARDLAQQAIAYPHQDNLTVALAATGVALTGAIALSGGTSIAGKAGVSAIKAARKLKRLSKGLERQLIRLTSDAIDTKALQSLGRAFGDFNLNAASAQTRRLIKPRVIKELTETGDAVRHVFARQGYRGTMQVLESADDTADIRKLRRVSDDLGPRFRGALMLKRGAKLTLHVAEIALAFLGWLISAAGWLVWAAYYAARLSWALGKTAFRIGAFALAKAMPGQGLLSRRTG